MFSGSKFCSSPPHRHHIHIGARYYTISQQHTWKSPLRIYQKAPVKTFWTVTVKQWNNSISWKVCFIITPHELKTEFIQCIACLSLVHEEKLWRWRKSHQEDIIRQVFQSYKTIPNSDSIINDKLGITCLALNTWTVDSNHLGFWSQYFQQIKIHMKFLQGWEKRSSAFNIWITCLESGVSFDNHVPLEFLCANSSMPNEAFQNGIAVLFTDFMMIRSACPHLTWSVCPNTLGQLHCPGMITSGGCWRKVIQVHRINKLTETRQTASKSQHSTWIFKSSKGYILQPSKNQLNLINIAGIKPFSSIAYVYVFLWPYIQNLKWLIWGETIKQSLNLHRETS